MMDLMVQDKPTPPYLTPALFSLRPAQQLAHGRVCSVGIASGWRLAADCLDGLHGRRLGQTSPTCHPLAANSTNLRQRRQLQSESDPSEGSSGMPSSPLEHPRHFNLASSGSGPIGLEQISNMVENRNFQAQKATFPPEGFTA